MKININCYVKVKLTSHGINILKKEHDELATVFPSIGDFNPPLVDEDGFSTFQLWGLMGTFGKDCNMGTPLPFETEIYYQERKQ